MFIHNEHVVMYIMAEPKGQKQHAETRGCSMKCWVCGKDNATCTRDIQAEYRLYYEIPVRKAVKQEHQRCYCETCYQETMERLREEEKIFTELRRKRMFEHALDKLERQQLDFSKYEDAIKTVSEYNENNDGKFDSSEEIMAAIILIHNRYHIKPQVKVGRYQVDFMLPEDFVILEIDGDRHKFNKSADSKRDRKIRETLGDKWQIIRIPTEFIDEKVEKLPSAIELMQDYRDTPKVHWRDL